MIKNPFFKKIIIGLTCILLVIIILLSPLQFFVFNMKIYLSLYAKNNVFALIDKNDALKLTSGIINLLKNGKDIEDFPLKSNFVFFTQNEIRHLFDVRVVIQKFLITFYISLILFFIFIVLIFQKNLFIFLKNIADILVFSTSIVILLILLAYFFNESFVSAFDGFHQIFFPQGNWAFPEDSLLITLLPLGFFYDFLIKMLKTSLMMSAIILLLGILIYIILKKLKGKNG